MKTLLAIASILLFLVACFGFLGCASVFMFMGLDGDPELDKIFAIDLALLSFFIGFASMVCVPIGLHRRIKLRVILASVAVLGVMVSVYRFWDHTQTNRGHRAEDFRFEVVKPTDLQLSGTWQGAWREADSKKTETLSITLHQTGQKLTGTIEADGDPKYTISEGTISSHQVHLVYAWTAGVYDVKTASLVGSVKGDIMTGQWYAHGLRLDGPFEVQRNISEK